MLQNLFDFLERVKKGLTKADARITVEVYNMGNGDGLKFQFMWYDDPSPTSWLKLDVFIPKDMIEYVFDEDFLSDYIIRFANLELDKYYKGESQ